MIDLPSFAVEALATNWPLPPDSSSALLRSLNDSFLENWAGVPSVAKFVGTSSPENWFSSCCWPSQELFAVIRILKYFQVQIHCIIFNLMFVV